jgi:hypothetical protein
VLQRGVLPKKVDKDPTWRVTAIYTREEIEKLISDRRIAEDRRVLHALKALGGLRHGEAAGRRVPVHPTLARVLSEWKPAPEAPLSRCSKSDPQGH